MSSLGRAVIFLATLAGGACAGNTLPPPATGHVANLPSWADSLFSPVLYRLGAPPLHSSTATHAIRLTYLPTFEPPFTLAVTSVADSAVVSAAFLDRPGGYAPLGRLRSRCHASLSRGRWQQLQAMISELKFWVAPQEARHFALDPTYLLFEGVDAGGYHVLFVTDLEPRVLILEGWLHHLARDAALPCYLSAGA